MKKILLFVAACAAFAACNKSGIGNAPAEGVAFVEGQKVVIGVSAPSTKVSSVVSDGVVDFVWEAGDQIKVFTDATHSAYFTLKDGVGQASATFEGLMPGTGTLFSVQYPYDTPNINNQVYSENKLPKDMVLFKANNCSLDKDITMEPLNTVLGIHLYGINKTVGSIEVDLKKEASKSTITLSCGDGVKLSSNPSAPTPFFVVVEAGNTYDSGLDVKVYDNSPSPVLLNTFSSSKSFTTEAKKVYDLAKKEVTGTTVTVTDIHLTQTSKTLLVGDSGVAAPTVEITPANATDKTCTWTSNDTGVVTVDSETGALTAVGTGKTTVTVTANGGYGVSTTLDVEVIGTTIEITVPQLAAANKWENGNSYNIANYGSFTFDTGANKYQYDSNNGYWVVESGADLTISSTLFKITKAVMNNDESAFAFEYVNDDALLMILDKTNMANFTLTLSHK